MDQTTDIYGKAEAELASIKSKIASLQKREEELRLFVELGKRLFADGQTGPVRRFNIPRRVLLDAPASEESEKASVRETSLKARVLALARQRIEQRGPQSTRDLVAFIEAQGIEVTGADKPTTVSVILSRSDEFVSDRTRGWSLAEKNPQDAATSAGSSTA